jgi:alpha-beta hydrolase superfamily lysophospholipase
MKKDELIGASAREKIRIDVDNLVIVGEIYYPPQCTGLQPALCLCHGIPAANRPSSDGGYPELAQCFAEKGFITCIFNFRGTGLSGGNLDLLGWTRDLDAVISRLLQIESVDESKIFLMGFSGGAAASAYVTAHDNRIASLALCACPAEFSPARLDMLLEQCRKIGTIRDDDFPSSGEEWRSHFEEINPIKWIDRISRRPLLILHGGRDELIDVAQAKRLYDKAAEPKKLVIIPEGEHKLRIHEAAMNTALAWFQSQKAK